MFRRKTKDERRENVIATLNLFQGKQSLSRRSKYGVSLITVLLFMLVATIAATATYKWITSEGRSSASRMMEREAYQSSEAGLENARTWMTYHANDVGDLIHQFIAGGNKPINLDGRLRTLQRAGQNYHVWMTGVNTDKPTYKIKLVSYGEARGGTRHGEAAIFNVDGLYRVKIPQLKISSNVDFHDALFGTLASAGNLEVSSATINGSPSATNGGGAAFTKVDVSDYLLVTGVAEFNSSTTVKDLYVLEGFSACANVTVTGNARIDKLYALAASAKFEVAGDLFTNNGVDLTQKPNTMGGCGGAIGGMFKIGGNLTSDGNFISYHSNVNNSFEVSGNLIVRGSMQFPSVKSVSPDALDDYENTHDFKKNVYIRDGFVGSLTDYSQADNLKFGSGSTNSLKYDVYIHNMMNFSDANGNTTNRSLWAVYDDAYPYTTSIPNTYVWCPGHYPGFVCSYKAYIWTDGYWDQVFAQIPGTLHSYSWPSTAQLKSWAADSMSAYANKLSTENKPTKCKTDYYVKDPIQLNKDIFTAKNTDNTFKYLHTSTDKKGCSSNIWGQWTDIVGALNDCHDIAKTNKELWQNEWLVVELTDPATFWNKSVLDGKFIIKINKSSPAYDLQLPSMTASSQVLIYFPSGYTKTITLRDYNSTNNNYFIFSEGDITDFQMTSGTTSKPMNGSVFMSNCAALNTKAHNSSVKANYNDDLVKNMASTSVICNNDGTSKCTPSGGGSGSGSSSSSSIATIVEGATDAYYVTMAPQLGISLESQNETSESFSETATNVTTLEPAFIVLPRVIYLPSDPYGKLSDYYSVLPLNGSTLKKTDVSIDDCSDLSGIPMVSGGAKLPEGTIYSCTAKASGHDDVPFWVVIGGDQRTTPSIYFVEPSQQMPTTTTTPIPVHAYIPAHASAITLSVSCPNLGDCGTTAGGVHYCQGDGWRYELQSNGTRSSSGICSFAIAASNSEQPAYPLFNVTTSGASNGTVTFHLEAGTGYSLTSPYSAELHVSSTATINRIDATDEDIAAWCANSTDCPSDLSSWPSANCTSSKVGTWVDATGVSHGTVTPNNSWSIGVGGTGYVSLAKAYTGNDCVVIIPPDDKRSISGVKANSTITPPLRASLKPKRKEFKVGFTGDVGEGKKPVIVVNIGESINSSGEGSRIKDAKCKHENFTGSDPKYCTYDVFPGEKVTFKVDDGTDSRDFNYWKCASDNCPNMESLNNKNYTTTPITISMDYTYTYLAHFGESDKHCFFEEFKSGTATATNSNRTNRNTLECSTGVEYCIDDCGGSGCSSAENASGYKWRLMGNALSSINYSSLYGYLSANKGMNKGKKESLRKGIVVMSSVNAGLNGTMKALVQLPSAVSQDIESWNIRGSGIVLHSNKQATEYLMLNLYVNSSGHLEAQVCKVSSSGTDGCTHEELVSGSSRALVSSSNMVMVNATFVGSSLIVSANTDKSGYYGNAPTTYSHSFDVSAIDFDDRAHEYVGFSLADPAFKIHGIGWHSDDYNADCFDTYPTVKCSFAAVADGGIVKTGTSVKPWVGYSGWFESSGACTEKFYYYNGNDACGSPSAGTKNDCGDGYTFAAGAGKEGPHGYHDGTNDVKTAKAWLECPLTEDVKANWWTTAQESEYAHCGFFWTGTYQECANDQPDLLGDLASLPTVSANNTVSISLERAPINLRKSSLNITMEGNNGEVEIWLESDNDISWGAKKPFESASVLVTGNTANFSDVVASFPSDSSGFNPEKVKRVMIKNHGTGTVTVKSISATCSNSIDIKECEATYNDAMGQWDITMTLTDATNRSNVEHKYYKADKKKNDVTESLYAYKEGNCQNGATDKEIVCSDNSRNPYNEDQGWNYQFTAKITGNTSRSTVEKACSVSPTTIGSISCGTPTVSKGEVPYGGDWPTFSFTMTGCPGGSCPYTIYLGSGAGSGVGSLLGNECGGGTEPCSGTATNSNAVNKTKSGKPLECTNAAGCEYTYTVKSPEGSAKPFSDCYKTFKVMPKGAITADCEFSPATVAKSGTARLSMTNIQNVDANTAITIERTGADPISKTLASGNSSQSFDITAPNPSTSPSSYTYTVNYMANGVKKSICSATLNVVDGLTCSLSPSSTITLGADVTFTATGGGNCTSSTLTGSATGAGTPSKTNCKEYSIHPTAPGNYTYTYTFKGDLGEGLHCPSTVALTVNPPAPVFTCPANWTGTVNSNVSLSLDPQYCGTNYANCTMRIDEIDGTGDDDYVAFSTPRSFNDSRASTSTTSYTVHVKNGTGDTPHSCPITYTTTSSTYRADCWFDKNGSVTRTPAGYQYTNFKTKAISGFPENNNVGTLSFNNTTYSVYIDQNGNTREYSNVPMPSNPGTYTYSVTYNSEKVCEGSITVAYPITCSVNPTSINGTTNVTFSALIDTALNRIYGLNLHDCGFKKDGNWKDNDQNPHGSAGGNADSWIQSVSTSTTFTYECKQGSGDKTCSKNVVLQAPPEITNCAALTSTKKTGDPVSIRPIVENCENNCEWHISGYENLDHNTRDWSSGGTIGLSTVNSDAAKNYKLTVENDYGDGDCDFTINYSSSAVCHCKCTNGCPDNVITTGWDGGNTGGCYFVSAFKIGAWNNSVVEVNGNQTFTNTEKSDSDYPTKVDGGYYIQFRSWYYPNISTFTAAEPTCN